MSALRGEIVLAALLLTACAREAASDESAASTAVEAMKATLTDALIHKDPAMVAALYSEDAVVLEPDGRVLEGRPAIAARIAALLPHVHGYSISSRRLDASGQLAYDRETFQLTLADQDAAPRTITGHQIVVLRRQADGTWRIVQSGSWVPAGEAAHQH